MAKSGKRVALVTGASAGIGKSIVRRLMRDGWTVYGAARRVDKMADIESEGAKAISLGRDQRGEHAGRDTRPARRRGAQSTHS